MQINSTGNVYSDVKMAKPQTTTGNDIGIPKPQRKSDSDIGIPRPVKTPEEMVYVEEKRICEDQVIGAIEKANKQFVAYDRKFEFAIHEKTKKIMVKVIDATNDEVIREIPAEKVLDMVAAMWEAAGIIIDKKI